MLLLLSGFAHQTPPPPRMRDGNPPIFGERVLNFAASHKPELGQARTPNARLCTSLLLHI